MLLIILASLAVASAPVVQTKVIYSASPDPHEICRATGGCSYQCPSDHRSGSYNPAAKSSCPPTIERFKLKMFSSQY